MKHVRQEVQPRDFDCRGRQQKGRQRDTTARRDDKIQIKHDAIRRATISHWASTRDTALFMAQRDASRLKTAPRVSRTNYSGLEWNHVCRRKSASKRKKDKTRENTGQDKTDGQDQTKHHTNQQTGTQRHNTRRAGEIHADTSDTRTRWHANTPVFLTVNRGFRNEQALFQHTHHIRAGVRVVQREAHCFLHLGPAFSFRL